MSAMFLVRRAGLGAVLGFAVGLSYFLPAVPVLLDVGAPLLESARTMVGNETLSVMVIAVLLSVSTRWAHSGPSRIAAAVVSIVLTALVMRLLVSPFTSVGWFEIQGGAGAQGATLFATWHVVAAGVILAVYYEQVRRAQTSAARLRSAQLGRQHAERDVIDSRLQVIRARVDPAFLFESLAAVRFAYDRDPDEAERLLDDLIRSLRASMPAIAFPGTALPDDAARRAA